MPLFDDIPRTETRPKRQNEASFDYLNSSARPHVQAVRAIMETWFEHMPAAAQADIRGRFRSRDEAQHQSAVYELYWHETLLRAGYQVQIHPAVAGVPTNPDFLALRNGTPEFYFDPIQCVRGILRIDDFRQHPPAAWPALPHDSEALPAPAPPQACS